MIATRQRREPSCLCCRIDQASTFRDRLHLEDRDGLSGSLDFVEAQACTFEMTRNQPVSCFAANNLPGLGNVFEVDSNVTCITRQRNRTIMCLCDRLPSVDSNPRVQRELVITRKLRVKYFHFLKYQHSFTSLYIY